MLILALGRAAVAGHCAVRALFPELHHLWQWVDVVPTSPEFEAWVRDRTDAGLDVDELRLSYTDGYIDDYMGSAFGRRRAFAVAAIFRGILRRCGFPLKASKECLPARRMTALGGDLDLDYKTAQLCVERAQRYTAEAASVIQMRRYATVLFRQLMGRLVSAAIYEPGGRTWLVAGFTALRQALRRDRENVFLGPGVKKELAFWVATINAAVGIPLFPAVDFPPPESPLHRIDWFDASTSWGMGGACLVRDGDIIVAYFFTYAWTEEQKRWHVNVMESLAGETILEAGHAVAPSEFVTGLGDNMTANAGHRNNATRNVQICAVLRHRGEFVKANNISTRPVYVNTKKNIIGDPLSRGPKYFQDFRDAATSMGATRFVRLQIPREILGLMDKMGSLYPAQAEQELEEREWKLSRPPTPSRPTPSPPALPPPPASSRLADIGIAPNAWTYVVAFSGLDTFMQAAKLHGGAPALACDNHDPARDFWQSRTGRQCLKSLAALREALSDEEMRTSVLATALVYTSGPPCTDFSRAGVGRGVTGSTGHLFLDDADAALEADLPIVITEIVVGVLEDHLIQFLMEKVRRLQSKYRVEWRIFRCNRHGDIYTNRRRILIVGVKEEFLRDDVTSLLPRERPPVVPAGLVDIIEEQDSLPDGLVFDQPERFVFVPARPPSTAVYDGLGLLARVDGQLRIGHQLYDASLAATIRTDGDGPGGATGLYRLGNVDRRLSPREAARTHSIDESTIDAMYKFVNRNPHLDAEKELFRFIGNSIPVMTLDDVLAHLLPLLRW
jgi:site-specific DNA-cytosine methylase